MIATMHQWKTQAPKHYPGATPWCSTQTCFRHVLQPTASNLWHRNPDCELDSIYIYRLLQASIQFTDLSHKESYSFPLTPSNNAEPLPKAAISGLYQVNSSGPILRQTPTCPVAEPRLDPFDADAIVGQIEAFQSAVFLQSLGKHLAANNHHRFWHKILPLLHLTVAEIVQWSSSQKICLNSQNDCDNASMEDPSTEALSWSNTLMFNTNMLSTCSATNSLEPLT